MGLALLFLNSLTASANGWRTPLLPTLSGPLRFCAKPKTLRSNNVNKATINK